MEFFHAFPDVAGQVRGGGISPAWHCGLSLRSDLVGGLTIPGRHRLETSV